MENRGSSYDFGDVINVHINSSLSVKGRRKQFRSGKAGQLGGVAGQLVHMRRLNHELVMVATVINGTTVAEWRMHKHVHQEHFQAILCVTTQCGE